jgi:superoxide reductase
MEENHYIEWVEVLVDDKAYRKFFNPGEKPEAEFPVSAEKVEAREYCSVHGLWKTP